MLNLILLHHKTIFLFIYWFYLFHCTNWFVFSVSAYISKLIGYLHNFRIFNNDLLLSPFVFIFILHCNQETFYTWWILCNPVSVYFMITMIYLFPYIPTVMFSSENWYFSSENILNRVVHTLLWTSTYVPDVPNTRSRG